MIKTKKTVKIVKQVGLKIKKPIVKKPVAMFTSFESLKVSIPKLQRADYDRIKNYHKENPDIRLTERETSGKRLVNSYYSGELKRAIKSKILRAADIKGFQEFTFNHSDRKILRALGIIQDAIQSVKEVALGSNKQRKAISVNCK
jgi:hypothetical protein